MRQNPDTPPSRRRSRRIVDVAPDGTVLGWVRSDPPPSSPPGPPEPPRGTRPPGGGQGQERGYRSSAGNRRPQEQTPRANLVEETLVTAIQTVTAETSSSGRWAPAVTTYEGELAFLPAADLDEPTVTPAGAATIDRIRALPWSWSPSVSGCRLLTGEPASSTATSRRR